MVGAIDRRLIEATRNADRITILLNEGTAKEMCIQFSRGNIRHFSHGVALAMQDYYNKQSR